jgi:hypothetical protein
MVVVVVVVVVLVQASIIDTKKEKRENTQIIPLILALDRNRVLFLNTSATKHKINTKVTLRNNKRMSIIISTLRHNDNDRHHLHPIESGGISITMLREDRRVDGGLEWNRFPSFYNTSLYVLLGHSTDSRHIFFMDRGEVDPADENGVDASMT